MSKSYCFLPNCRSTAKKNPELSFHKFPAVSQTVWTKDKFGNWEKERVSRRHLWIKSLKIQCKINDAMKICSLHFLPEDFCTRGKYRVLKRNTVPSVNLPIGDNEQTFVAVCNESITEGYDVSVYEQDDPLGSQETAFEAMIEPKIEPMLKIVPIKPEEEYESMLEIKPELEIEPQLQIEPKLEFEPELEFEPQVEFNTEMTFNDGASCIVAKCGNYKSKTGPSISYHQFPKEVNLRNKWMKKCQRWKCYPTDLVCSRHFTPDDFEHDIRNEALEIPLIRKLRKSAVPSLFLPSMPLEEVDGNIEVVLEEQDELERLRQENIELKDNYLLLKNTYNTKIRGLEFQIKCLQSMLSRYKRKLVHKSKRLCV